MNKKMIARELVLVAKKLIAEDKDGYVYDPDHKHKPKGGGWEKTERGWTTKKKENGKSENRYDFNKVLELHKKFDQEDEDLKKYGIEYVKEKNYYEKLSVTKNKNEILDAFSEFKKGKKNWELGCAISKNPSTPTEVLSFFTDEIIKGSRSNFFDSASDRGIVAINIAKNPRSSKDVLDKLKKFSNSRMCPTDHRHSLLRAIEGPKNELDEGMLEFENEERKRYKDLKQESEKYNRYCEKIKETDNKEEILNGFEKYKKSPNDDFLIGFSIVQNPNTPSEILDYFTKELLKGENSEIDDLEHRMGIAVDIAKNPNSSQKTIDKLIEISKNNKLSYGSWQGKIREEIKKRKQTSQSKDLIDLSKLSPELREEVKDMTPEELGKFISWLKKRKGMDGGTGEEVEV